MSLWRAKPSTLFFLGCMTFFMILIVVLPDVGLPGTGFQRGAAPLIFQAQANSAPVAVSLTLLVRFPEREDAVLRAESTAPPDDSAPNFRHILLRSLRC